MKALSTGTSINSTNAYITPEEFGAKGDGISDDLISFRKMLVYSKVNNCTIDLKSMYYISERLELYRGCDLTSRNGKGGFIYISTGAFKKPDSVLYINTSNVKLSNIKIIYKSLVEGNIHNIPLIGVFLDSKSSYCSIDNLNIVGEKDGFYGWSHCIRLTGSNHTLENSRIQNGTMCVSIRGRDIILKNNIISNNFKRSGNLRWSEHSKAWDGIVMEGCHNCRILSNKITDCGQSGIYCGGNGSVSTNISVIGNYIADNWNRGIDFGVSGNVSETNYLSDIVIINNFVSNNRKPQIWLKNVVNYKIKNNRILISKNMKHLYGDQFSGYNGIVIVGRSTNDNIISNNYFEAEGLSIINTIR